VDQCLGQLGRYGNFLIHIPMLSHSKTHSQ
jgi:hypothetical protein